MHFSIRCFVLFFFILMSVGFAHAGAAEKNAAALEPAAGKTETQDIYHQSNDNVLKQAQNIFNEASNKFLAEVRRVSGGEKLLEQVRLEIGTVVIPEESPPVSAEDTPALEVAKIALEHTKKRVDAFKGWLKINGKEKKLLEDQIARIEAARSSADIFTDSIKRLGPFLYEIELRIGDGTLAGDKVPALLNAQEMENKKQELAASQEELKKKAHVIQGKLDNVVLRIEEVKNTVFEMEAHYSSANQKYSQELKWNEQEQEYSRHQPEKLLAQLSELQEEQVWLNGAYNLTHRRFKRRVKKVSRTEKELEELSQSEAAKLQVTEDIQAATKAAEDITAYHGARIEKLEKLRSAQQSLVKQAKSFEEDATVLSGHVFNMQVVAKTLDKFAAEGKITVDSIPQEVRAETLATVADTLLKQRSEVLTAKRKAGEQLDGIDSEAKKSEAARKEVKEKLANLQKIHESAQQARQWESKLKDLTDEQLVQKFQESIKKSGENQLALQKLREEFKKAQAAVEKEKLKLESLKDPLLRSAQQESQQEKRNVLNALYKFAGLDLPAEKARTSAAAAATAETKGDKAAGKSSVKKEEARSNASETEAYQNLLSTRTGVIEKRREHRTELLKALNALNKQIEQYTNVLTEAEKLALQHHANAVELKKRLGRGQLANSEIPEGISEALKPELISRLEQELAELLNYQASVRQRIESLGQRDETLKETSALLGEAQKLAGKRFDILNALQKLEQALEKKGDTLSETEQKTLDQTAVRRMESEDSMEEVLLRLVPSARAESLTDLMQVYYQELTVLDIKRENLRLQKGKVERVIRLAEEEKPIISKLLPLFQKQKAQLEIAKEEEWVKIRVLLMPEKAGEILGNFETKTGRSLSTPAPLPEKDRIKIIEEAANLVFDRHIRMVATNKWTDLFGQRLSPAGIGAEIGQYQDKLGALDARDAAIQRHTQHIKGRSQDDLAKLDADEKPKTEADKRYFLEGEVGMLRADRYDTRRQEATRVLIKVAAIFLIAVFLVGLSGLLIGRAYKKAERAENPQSMFVLSFLRTFIKVTVWVIAIIMIFSMLGFDVGTVVAGLGIGGLAIAMAARETLANMLGGITIFIERPFTIGDIVKIGSVSAQKVVSMSWRSTRLVNPFMYYTNIPNSQVAGSNITNYTSYDPPGDYISVFVPPEYEPERIKSLISEALAECESKFLMKDQAMGAALAGTTVYGSSGRTMMEYWPWWATKNYHLRNGTRADVWNSIWKKLSKAGITPFVKKPED